MKKHLCFSIILVSLICVIKLNMIVNSCEDTPSSPVTTVDPKQTNDTNVSSEYGATISEQIYDEPDPLANPQLLLLKSSLDKPISLPSAKNEFFLYVPDNVNIKTPVIIACHGYTKDPEEIGGFGEGNFALYLQVYQGYHPDAIIVFPYKYSNGDWDTNEIVNLTRAFIQTYQLTSPVYYYGFSQGCLNGPEIISKYGKFKAAVFVDEDFLTYPYPTEDDEPLGIQRASVLLSSLSALRIAGCTYVDSDYNRKMFSYLLTSQGKVYNEEIYPKNSYKHLEVHELTVVSNIEWLLNQ